MPALPLRTLACLTVVVAFWNSAALAQAPGTSAAARRVIEARLPAAAKETANDAQVGEAVGKAVVDFLDLALPPDLLPGDIVGEAVQKRAGQVPAVVAILSGVTEALLTLEPDPPVRGALDEATTAACLAVTPQDVSEVVRSQIALLATSGTAQVLLYKGKRPLDELLPVEAYAERVVAGAIKALRKVPTQKLARHIEDTAAKALSVAPPYLYEEIAASSARSSSSGTVILAPLTGGASNLLKTLLAGVPDTKEDVGAIVAGVLRGRGAPVIAAVKVELANNKPAFSAYTDAVLEGFQRCVEDHREFHFTYLRDAGAKYDRVGLLTGASILHPGQVVKFAQLGMELPGANSILEIARGAARAVPIMAPETAAYCVGTRGTKAEEIVQGLVEGGHDAVLGGIVARQLQAMGTMAGADARKVVAGAILGARKTGKEHALPALVLEAARASRFPSDVAEQAIAAVPPAMKALAGLAALAPDSGSAPEVAQHVRALLADDPAQKGAFDIGAAAVLATQNEVRNFLSATLDGLAASGTDAARLAVIHGVGFVNPKGAAVIAAAGIARSEEKLWPAVTEAATLAGPARAAGVRLATEAARSLRKSAGADLEPVTRALFLHPRHAADIAAAAVLTAPDRAPQIAQAAARNTGPAVARMVPALLAFSQLQQRDAAKGEPTAAAARITGAVVSGLLEAGLRDRETAAITGAVDAAVQWACASGTGAAPAQPVALLATPEVSLAPGSVLEAVVKAAVGASKAHGIAIARVAAETLTAYTRGTFTDTEGRLAALVREAGALNFGGSAASDVEIRNAIAFGITAHNATEAGAGALNMVNYSRTDGIGRPVAEFRDE